MVKRDVSGTKIQEQFPVSNLKVNICSKVKKESSERFTVQSIH